MPILQLNNLESSCALALESRPAGTYRLDYSVLGNGIYSSLFVKSVDAGATLTVNYYDKGIGGTQGEKVLVGSHTIVDDTTPLVFSDPVCIPKHHGAPFLEAVVTGGNVEFGIFSSIREISALELAMTFNAKGEDCIRVCGESVPQGLSELGLISLIPISPAAWTEVTVVPISGRRAFAIQNTDGAGVDNPDIILLNYAPFAPAGGSLGYAVRPGAAKFYDASDGVNIFIRVVAGGGSFNIVFEQLK